MAAQPKRAPEAEPLPGETPGGAPAEIPRLRPRPARADDAASGGASEVRRLQDRVADAFSPRPPARLERLLIKLLIVAATCVTLSSVLVNGGEILSRILN